MNPAETLLLSGSDISRLLNIEECIDAVEKAFRLYGEGRALPAKVLGIHAKDGVFHIKAGILELSRNYFVAKLNANFPNNSKRCGLPTIQGVVAVCDGDNGRMLALLDSIGITILRTGAATAVAAKYLSATNAQSVTICGCGNQGKISLKALLKVRPIKRVYAYDIDNAQMKKFVEDFSPVVEISETERQGLSKALQQSEICVTCTPSKLPFIDSRDISPGTFIAAVGADNEEKQELSADLLANSKVVVDILEQASKMGDLHHAIAQNKMVLDDVHAELGEIVAGKKPGRESDQEVIVFDSTGTAMQDIVAAAIVYERAIAIGDRTVFNFSL